MRIRIYSALAAAIMLALFCARILAAFPSS
jgi:hypothetical protein